VWRRVSLPAVAVPSTVLQVATTVEAEFEQRDYPNGSGPHACSQRWARRGWRSYGGAGRRRRRSGIVAVAGV